MATFTKLQRQRGTRWRAQIRLHVDGQRVTQAKTFPTKAQAQAWATRREQQLADDPALAARDRHRSTTLASLIQDYTREAGDAFGRSKRAALAQLAEMPIAETRIGALTPRAVVEHTRARRAAGAGPATANQDLIWLRLVIDYARTVWGTPVSLEAFDDGARICRRERLVGASKVRSRRPTAAELERICAVLARKRTPIPLVDIVWFAVHSARRLGEITRLRWADLDREARTCWVRDAKNPRGSAGNHKQFALTREALAIIERQPHGKSPLIFPFHPKTIGDYFARAVRIAEIDDLRFHDLRHEATSRLFEAGYSIVEVQQFTLHEDWKVLKRYTNLRPADVKER